MIFIIITTVKGYKNGKAFREESSFPKIFKTEKEALTFGKSFFEPPQSVLAWRIINNKKKEE